MNIFTKVPGLTQQTRYVQSAVLLPLPVQTRGGGWAESVTGPPSAAPTSVSKITVRDLKGTHTQENDLASE